MNKLKRIYRRIVKLIKEKELLRVSLYIFSFVFLTFAIQSVPNGLTLPINGDYILQQLHFYYEGYDAYWSFFTTGEFPMWSYRGFLGVNYFAANTFYYLTSPFIIPMLLVPRFLIPQMIFIMYMVKLTVGGLLMFILLRRYFKNSYIISLIGATAYALSGWGMFYLWFNHFADVLAVFPLMFIGIEHLLKYKKGWLLALSVIVMGLVNYFFLFGFVILITLYAFARYFQEFKVNKGFNLEIIVKGSIYYFLGILATSFILLPAFLIIRSNPRIDGSSLIIELLGLFFETVSRLNGGIELGSLKSFGELFSGTNLVNIFRYFFIFAERFSNELIPSLQTQLYPLATFFYPPVNNWDSLVFTSKTFDNVYSSLYISTPLALLLIPSIIKTIKSKNILNIAILIIVILLPFIPFVYYLMAAFSQIYGRWQIFIVVLSIIYIVPILEDFRKNPKRWLDVSIIVVLSIMVSLAIYSFSLGKLNNNFFKLYGVIAMNIFVVLTYVYIRFFLKGRDVKNNLLYLVTIDLLIMANFTQIGQGVSNYWNLYGGREIINEHQEIINDLNKEDPSFYRIFADLADRNNNNLSISLDYKGIATFHSIYSFGLYEFLNEWSKIPYSYGNWSMGVDEKRIYLDSFLNVKYYILPNEDKNIPVGYLLHRSYPNYSVYINEYHVELGYAFDQVISSQDFTIYYDYFQHEHYYNQLAVVSQDDLNELKEKLGIDSIGETNQLLPFRQFNLNSAILELLLRGEDEAINVGTDIYFAGNYLPSERNNTFYGPFIAQDLIGDKITVHLDQPVCVDATSTNVCQVILKMSYGPNIKVSFFKDERLIVEDAHGVSNFDKSGDQKFARSFYLREASDRIEFEFMSDANNDLFIKNGIALFYQYQEDYIEKQKTLMKNSFNNIEHTSNKISFETDYDSAKMIVLSVPYDQGWKLKVNGVDTKIHKVNSGFMGMIALAGEQQYELEYATPGIDIGLSITLIALLLILAMIALDKKKKRMN
jgi:uncharacterized membrane protein YfhO